MPIYDYVCTSCRHRIEVIHGIHDAGPRFCPACGEEATMLKALVSPAVHFKGSGWAKKDRSSAGRARARSGEGSSAGGADGDSSDSSSRDTGSREGSSREGSSPESASARKDAAKAESGTASAAKSPASED
ncbi:MAG TPA: zinc ribbon domain-containing protein [Candidatus Limnocylindria bacterium]|nr:zinc ribbon domain-containing protein [Candidatus Limnocylindria bacterium]